MNRGFTILEVVLATLVLSIIGTLTWGALSATFRTQKTITERTEIQEIGTALLMKLRDDISQTFYVQTQAQNALTFFKGEDNFDQDRLSFTSLSHFASGPDAKESDQCEIIYKTESHPTGQGLYLLQRRENPHLDGEIDETGDFLTVSDRVVSFNLEYKQDIDFKNSWDISESDNLHKLPEAVKITLVLRDHRDRDESFEALVDLPMGETLNLSVTPVPNAGSGTPQPATGRSGSGSPLPGQAPPQGRRPNR